MSPDSKPKKLSKLSQVMACRLDQKLSKLKCRGGQFYGLVWLYFHNYDNGRRNEDGLQVHVHVNAGDSGRGSGARGGRRGRRGRGGRQVRERALPAEDAAGMADIMINIAFH